MKKEERTSSSARGHYNTSPYTHNSCPDTEAPEQDKRNLILSSVSLIYLTIGVQRPWDTPLPRRYSHVWNVPSVWVWRVDCNVSLAMCVLAHWAFLAKHGEKQKITANRRKERELEFCPVILFFAAPLWFGVVWCVLKLLKKKKEVWNVRAKTRNWHKSIAARNNFALPCLNLPLSHCLL